MAEYHGMLFPGARSCPVFNVDAVTYRHNPILPICVTVCAAEENHTVWSLMQAAEVLDICQKADLPIKMALSPFAPTASGLLCKSIARSCVLCEPIPGNSADGDKTREGEPGKVVKCCMLPAEFTEEKLQWNEASLRSSYRASVRQKVADNWAAYGFRHID